MCVGPRLSMRLATVLSLLGGFRCLADVGCDHSYLAIHAALRARPRGGRVIACDSRRGPLEAGRANARDYGVECTVEHRQGDGLEPIAPGEADTLCIAGMGQGTLVGILERDARGGRRVLAAMTRLVLQANGHADELRVWLSLNGWAVTDEVAVLDGGRWYVADVAVPGQCGASHLPLGWPVGLERLRQIGISDRWPMRLCPLLIGSRSPSATGLVEHELERTRGARRDIGSADGLRATRARAELAEDIRELEAIGRWLSGDAT